MNWAPRTASVALTAILGGYGVSGAAPLYTDTFSSSAAYLGGTTTGNYTASDGLGSLNNTSAQSTWIAGGGTLTYTRPDSGNDPTYNYQSSVLLTDGADTSGGNTAGLSSFTVSGILYDIPATNTDQPGLVISGSAALGGYVVQIDNGAGNDFALLAEDSNELLGDEEVDDPGKANVLADLFHPTQGDSYNVSATEYRPAGGYPSFDIVITDLSDPGVPVDSGLITQSNYPSSFGGTQIGYRVRNPLDAQTPQFGTLILSVPEPASFALLTGAPMLLLRRRLRRSGAHAA